MFKDITQASSGADATLEILILLSIAFLFGLLFGFFLWAPKKEVGTQGAAAPSTPTPEAVVPNAASVNARPVAQEPVSVPEIQAVASEPVADYVPTVEAVEQPSEEATEAEMAHLENLLAEASRNLEEEEDAPEGEAVSAFALPVEIVDEPTEKEVPIGTEIVYEFPAYSPTPAPEPDAPANEEGDDLRRIEGIGPITERILKEGGILTYAQLAELSPEGIMAVLLANSERNKRFQSASETWPAQAVLARDGRWDELAQWKEKQRGA